MPRGWRGKAVQVKRVTIEFCPVKFMIIAGEASGDTLGAELVRALRARVPNAEFFGAGGPRLAEAGARLEFDLAAHAVVGIWEVVKNYSKFKAFFDHLLSVARERQPDVVVLIDYPGFNLRFAKVLRQFSRAKIVYYVSPQIWAWHESRVHQIAKDVDLMLAIFPFEKAWYAERVPNFKVEFVGHPLIDRYAGKEYGQGENARRLLLLPGSRVRELKKHLPAMVEAVALMRRNEQFETRMVLPNERLLSLATGLVNLTGIDVRVGGLAEELAQATVAIASSGTVTMECAYFRMPTVVMYRTSWSTYALGRRFIKVKYLAMPNLLAGEKVYPEFIQEEASAENLARAAADLLNNPAERGVMKAKLDKVIESLGGLGASGRAADAIVKLASGANE
jgi:lipid-A-disaccharide synthase